MRPEKTPALPSATPGEGGADQLAVPVDAGLAEDVVDGEIVDEEEAAQQRPTVYVLRPVVQVFQTINVVVRHEHTRAAGRHAAYIPAGVVVAWRRHRRGRSLALDFAHQAKAQGDHANGLLWAQQHEAALKARHERHEKRVRLFIDLLKVSPWILGVWVFLMIATGVCLAFAHHSPYWALWPWKTLVAFVSDLVALAAVAVWVLSLGAPVVLFAFLHHLGRTAGDLAPGWSVAAKAGKDDRGLVVTADTIVLALQNIPVPELKKAFKDGWRPSFPLLPVRDGRGYGAEFSVPLGVTPEKIADQRPVFARNLHRDEIEVWPSAGAPGYARLWVADPGAIGKAAPEYPLLHEGEADVFQGVPGGVVARGDGALIPINEATIVLGGLPGQGKSNAGRVIMLGCCTDPICAADVFVFANNGDFDAFEPRLAVYRKGLDDDVIEAAMEYLHETYLDVGERERMLADLGAKKVTRALALQYPELRPRVTLLSECHELFGHPEYGEMAGELAVKTAKRARKTARVIATDTQSSRTKAIPGAFVELASVNVCFAVKGWRNNDGFLGDGSFQAGIRATELRPKRDRGTALVTGISDEQFELLKWYYIEVDDDTGRDDARPVIERCMKAVDPRTPVAGSAPALAITSRDLLEDLAEVIEGPDRVRLAELPPRLRKLDKAWLPYRSLDGVQLAELLDRESVKWVRPGNVPQLDPAELHRAMSERRVS